MRTTPETDFPFATKDHSKLVFIFRKRIHRNVADGQVSSSAINISLFCRGEENRRVDGKFPVVLTSSLIQEQFHSLKICSKAYVYL